ncbi:RNA recognition motif-containing protein [Besnoitia besnoiti]|uniref:RNA recognition motif-containing protein n=1 Tax=Besnoitia besnoiti TaxID=94643 RepID=A0A2A9MN00_BESBE|nr:RNA recognition motif-containing protein [Besnoitia besnoiti]PFH37000.1 RNA recognition motif-containing protein [Besnoitia besnoiti]
MMAPAAASQGSPSGKSRLQAAKASSTGGKSSRAASAAVGSRTAKKATTVSQSKERPTTSTAKPAESDIGRENRKSAKRPPEMMSGGSSQRSSVKKVKRSSSSRQSTEEPDTEKKARAPGKSRSASVKDGRTEQAGKPKSSASSGRGVIYLGHLPHGFFEPQLKKFFSQFGKVTRVELRRSKRTGNSKGFAFIEFELPEVATIVAEAMNNYMMFGRTLVCHVVPPHDLSEKVFSGGNKKFKRAPSRLIAAGKHNKADGEMSSARQVNRKIVSDLKKQRRLKELGIDFSFDTVLDGVKASEDAGEGAKHRRSVNAWVRAQVLAKKQTKKAKAAERRQAARLKNRKQAVEAASSKESVSSKEATAAQSTKKGKKY